jgi:chromosome partitioning protein
VTRIYALVNQKGGVGKTTTAINLGAYLALQDRSVLIIDLDPQANATASLGVEHGQVTAGTYDVIIGNSPPLDVILHNRKLELSLMPSSPALAGAQIEMVDVENREKLLRESIAPVRGKYDYVLIDCPPSLGLLTLNGLIAAGDGVIIPVQCEYLALEGLTQLMHTLNRVRSSIFAGLTVRGLLLTMYDSRTNLSNDVVDEVRKYFQNQVFQTIIPRSVRLAEAPSHGLPVSAYAPQSPGALAYAALSEEILKGDGR